MKKPRWVGIKYDRGRTCSPRGLTKSGPFKGFKGTKVGIRRFRYNEAVHPTNLHSLHDLYPDDCYIMAKTKQFHRIGIPYLQDEAPDDIVAKVENAELVGMDIPSAFEDHDLLLAFIPTRRLTAFCYATLDPEILDNFPKAVRAANIDPVWISDFYRNAKYLYFASNFWRERVSAQAGLVMLYAQKYARDGSPNHLRIMGELTKQLNVKEEKHEHKHEHLHVGMPDDPGDTKQLTSGESASAVIDAKYEELIEVPR